MADQNDVLIVGGGHAGAQAAIALRQMGFEGSVTIVTDERDLPYERPPLSKEYLSGERPFERILLRPPAFWTERKIRIDGGRRIVAVDPERHMVAAEDGGEMAYRHLIWAAGGEPRRLTCRGSDLRGVHGLRSRVDADRLRLELPAVKQAVVVGGGYIGLEAAAALRKAGKDVIVLEAFDRVLARVAGEPLSRFYETEHRKAGVDVRLGQQVSCIEGDGKVAGVRLADGSLVPADLVVVGIGILPSTGPLSAAGAAGENGVLVDEYCRTSLPDVLAIGDCALHHNRFTTGKAIRLESVQNANDQAAVAVKAIMGDLKPYDAVPWFWSNQYDLKLQTIGLSSGYDEVVVRGDPDGRSFSVIYCKEGRVIALDCVNAVKDYVQGRRLVSEGLRIAPDLLKDSSAPLKQM